MSSIIYLKEYASLPPVDIGELFRYSGLGKSEPSYEFLSEVDEIIKDAEGKLTFRICYRSVNIDYSDNCIMLENLRSDSGLLKRRLKNSSKAIVFAATVGMWIDRKIIRYGSVSPLKSLIYEALGNERIEALCDEFENDMRKKYQYTTDRFSPGYGDFDIGYQRDIFRMLDCQRKIGLTLNESLMMSPSKSVTAIMGIGRCGDDGEKTGKCEGCSLLDCTYRING